jgi:hypothetical protein
MTQETTTPLADRAARTAEKLEEYSRADDGPIMQYLAATGTEATINDGGFVKDAWIVVQPSCPRVEFHPLDSAVKTYADGDDFTRSIFDGEADDAIAAAGEYLTLTFNGMEIEL